MLISNKFTVADIRNLRYENYEKTKKNKESLMDRIIAENLDALKELAK